MPDCVSFQRFMDIKKFIYNALLFGMEYIICGMWSRQHHMQHSTQSLEVTLQA